MAGYESQELVTIGARRTKSGAILTIVWLGLSVALVLWKRDTVGNLGLNDWGDFLAGVSAPIAFLWLVLGYLQQGDELKQNTAALRAQEEQLRLQVLESRELVEQYRRHAEASHQLLKLEIEKQQEEKERVGRLLAPSFVVEEQLGTHAEMVVKIRNDGGDAFDLTVTAKPGIGTHLYHSAERIPQGGVFNLQLRSLTGQDLHGQFHLHYRDATTTERHQTFMVDRGKVERTTI